MAGESEIGINTIKELEKAKVILKVLLAGMKLPRHYFLREVAAILRQLYGLQFKLVAITNIIKMSFKTRNNC